MPKSLEYLFCTNNQIKIFPKLPTALRSLVPNENPLITREELPKDYKPEYNLRQLCRLKVGDIKGKKLHVELPTEMTQFLNENRDICGKCTKDYCGGDISKRYYWDARWDVPCFEYVCFGCSK